MADPFDAAQLQFMRDAQARSVGASEEDPDEAARSVELGNTFNAPPSVVHMDQDAFVQRQKERLNSTIIQNNENVQKWINSHPMAAAVSNDDLPNIDDYTTKLEKLVGATSTFGSPLDNESIASKTMDKVIDIMFRPFETPPPTTPPERQRYYEAYPFMKRFEDTILSAQMGVDQGYELFARTMDAVFGTGLETAIKETGVQKLGMDPQDAGRLGRDSAGMIFEQMMRRGAEPKLLEHMPQELGHLARSTGPWIRNKEVPPYGVHPATDAVIKEQAKVNIEGLEDAVKAGQNTNLIDRPGDMFRQLTGLTAGDDAVVHVDAAAVKRLYGDKAPTPDDNILGRVPDIAQQLSHADAHGGKIEVPLADWIQFGKDNPEAHQALRDDFQVERSGDGGLTRNEMKEEVPPTRPVEGEAPPTSAEDRGQVALEGYRRAAGLEPAFSPVPEVTAVRVSREDIDEPNVHRFDIQDETGRRVGGAVIRDEGENIHIESIAGGTTKGLPGFFGMQMVGLLRQLREEFPNMKSISGLRGAGPRAGELVKVDLPPKGGAKDWLEASGMIHKPFTSQIPATAEVGPKEVVESHVPGDTTTVNPTHKFFVRDVDLAPAAEQEAPGIKAIINFIGDKVIKRLAGDVPIYVVTKDDMARLKGGGQAAGYAWYDRDGNPYIIVRGDYVDGSLSEKYASRLLIHEAAHTISTKEIDNPKNKTIREAIRRIMNETDKYLSELDPEARKKHYYAYTDEREFVAETFARGDFQDLLRQIPLPESLADTLGMDKKTGNTLWDGFRDAMRRMWQGILKKPVPNNALDAMLKMGEHIENFGKMMEEAEAGRQKELERTGALGAKRPPWAKYGGPMTPVFEAVKKREPFSFVKKLIEEAEKIKPELTREEWDRKRNEIMNRFREGEVKGEDLDKRIRELGPYPAEEPPAAKQLEFPGMEGPMAERDILESAAAAGMTAREYKIIQANKAKMDAADKEHQIAQAERRERVFQTSKWKEEFERVKDELKTKLGNRSDIALDNFLREGNHYGDKVKGRPRINSDKLTEEQKRGLPKDYLQSEGVDPQDLAEHFGYGTVDQMLNHLKQLLSDRKDSNLGPKTFVSQLAEKMTQASMEHEFGNLEKIILEGAKDHIFDKTQIDELHERVIALAQEFGNVTHVGEIPIKKEALEAWVKQDIAQTPIGRIKSKDFIASAGKADRAARNALDKPRDYLKARQDQRVSMLMGKAATEYEKQRESFDKRVKSASKPSIDGVAQRYLNFVHDIMSRIGVLPARLEGPTVTEIGAGAHKTLKDMLDEERKYGLIIPVADFLLDPNFRTPLEKLTYEEFQGVHDSIKTLLKAGRDENKLMIRGQEMDRAELVSDMKKAQASFPVKERKDIGLVRTNFRNYIANSINLETLFNMFDRNNPMGVHNQVIVRNYSEAANRENALEREFAREFNKLPQIKDPNKVVENSFFRDMNTVNEDGSGGTYLRFTRRNLMAVLQNMGNSGNFFGLLDGYGIDRARAHDVLDWIDKNTTKEDWDRAQALGKIFEKAKQMSDEMYRDLTGVAPISIEKWPISHPTFGDYEGWYHPRIYDRDQPQMSEKVQGAIEYPQWVKTSPSAGYTKSRTGYKGPYLLNFDQIPFKLGEIIHDIAFRPSLVQLSKVFRDQSFVASVRNHAGKQYADLLMPFLRDIADSHEINSSAQGAAYALMDFVRTNMISHLVGLNPATLAKHTLTALVNSISEVGPTNYLRWQANLLGKSEYGTGSNWEFAHAESEEIQRRFRNYYETVRGSNQRVFGDLAGNTFTGQFLNLRDAMLWVEAAPLAMGDLLSAVPTWLAAYDKARREGNFNHGDAVFQADRALRRAHGSTAITFRPGIARSKNPFVQSTAAFYGFFSHILQKQFEGMWEAKAALRGEGFYLEAPTDTSPTITLRKGKGYTVEGQDYKQSKAYKMGLATLPVLTMALVSYMIMPSMIEELVSPGPSEEKFPKIEKQTGIPSSVVGYGLSQIRGLTSSWLWMRDLAHGVIDGGDVSSGLFGQSGKYMSRFVHDLVTIEKPRTVQEKQKMIQQFNDVFSGMVSGFPGHSLPRMGIFGYNYYTGRERLQKGPSADTAARQIWRGVTTGTMKKRP